MHELAITQHILEIVTRHAQTAHARRVTHIHLVIGELSSFVDDSIQFYWDIISEGTLAYGATLHFKRIEARFACLGCGTEYRYRESGLLCPACGSHRNQRLAGEEFFVESIEIEEQAQ